MARYSMARPTTDLPPAAEIRALVDSSGCLRLRVTPGARVQSITIARQKLAVKVRVKPEDGKANQAVVALLATALEIAPSRLSLVRGATGRDKTFRIADWPD